MCLIFEILRRWKNAVLEICFTWELKDKSRSKIMMSPRQTNLHIWSYRADISHQHTATHLQSVCEVMMIICASTLSRYCLIITLFFIKLRSWSTSKESQNLSINTGVMENMTSCILLLWSQNKVNAKQHTGTQLYLSISLRSTTLIWH